MWNVVIEKVVPNLIKRLTPEVRGLLEKVIEDLKAKARKTDNPIDDMLVGLLAAMLGFRFKG